MNGGILEISMQGLVYAFIPVLAVLLIIFVLQNTEMVIINLFFWDISIPRALLIFVCFAMGLVIGLALQGTLSNFASGILMLIYRPFDMGDMINVAGTLGTVESMNLLSTQLRTPDNQLIIVPNNSVWGDMVKLRGFLAKGRISPANLERNSPLGRA